MLVKLLQEQKAPSGITIMLERSSWPLPSPSNDEQSEKAYIPICLTPLMSPILSIFEQPEKAQSPIRVTEGVISIDVKDSQPENAYHPISEMPEGISTDSKLLQFPKVLYSIFLTLEGRTTFFNDMSWNAPARFLP